MTATLMTGLMDAPGHYRRCGVAVMDQGRIHHVGPPAERTPRLMADLPTRLGSTGERPLVARFVLHYGPSRTGTGAWVGPVPSAGARLRVGASGSLPSCWTRFARLLGTLS